MRKPLYDEKIAPLMTQIIAVCKEHRIPMVAQFELDLTPDDGPLFCTTVFVNGTYSEAIRRVPGFVGFRLPEGGA